jgi:hypothetical protein
MDRGLRWQVIGNDTIAEEYTLKGFERNRLLFNPIYPNISRCNNKSVKGLLVNVDDDDIDRLKRYETDMYKLKSTLVTYIGRSTHIFYFTENLGR